MIIWASIHATPQFVPVLNQWNERGVAVDAHFAREGSGGREWGDLTTTFPTTFHGDQSLGMALWSGFRAASDPRVTAVIVLGYSLPLMMGVLLAARLRGVPVFTLSDSNLDIVSKKGKLSSLRRRVLLRLLLRRNTRVWTVSEANSKFWSHYGYTNQVRIRWDSPVPRPSDADSISPEEGRILFVGRLSPEKRVDVAISAIRILRQMNISASLRLVGPTDEQLTSAQLGGYDWITAVGPVAHADLGREYLAAQVLVLPSSEAFGLVVREALQFGVPVVATTEVPAALELCDHEWNIVSPGDVDGLAEALNKALHEPRWRELPVGDLATALIDDIVGLRP